MANYHLQFDDNDVKNGLLNVDPDGCLKLPKPVLFWEDRGGVTYCCGRPASEMTLNEAYDLCCKYLACGALYNSIPGVKVASVNIHGSSSTQTYLMATYVYATAYAGSGPTVSTNLTSISVNKFKSK